MQNALRFIALLTLPACGAKDDTARPATDLGTPEAPALDASLPADAARNAGLPSAPVEVRWDTASIPHVYGQTDADTFFGAGWAQAKDRLFALEIQRRQASGTLAEIFGERSFKADLQAHVFEFSRWGALSIRRLAETRPEEHALIVAFTAGLNRRVDEVLSGAAPRPPEFDTWAFDPRHFTPEDLMAAGFRINFGFSSTLEYDLLYTVLLALVHDAPLLPIFVGAFRTTIMDQGVPEAFKARHGVPGEGLRIDPSALSFDALRRMFRDLARFRDDLFVGEGSNSFAVRGDLTDNGRPYLANDSHARLANPNLMFWSHLNSADAGGRFDVIGMGFNGVPGVQVGHNRKVVWGATTHFADMTDLFAVPVEGDFALLGGERVALERREVEIRVKTETGLETRTEAVKAVPGRGVFLPDSLIAVPRALVAQHELMLAWPGFEPTVELAMYLDFDRSETLDDFAAAVEQQRTGMQNWTFATAEGTRYKTRGAVPDRGPVAGRAPANRILDGTNPAHLWTGDFLPKSANPSLDGTQPFIATANNCPWGHTADNDPLNDDFYYGSFYAPGFRAGRLVDRLGDLTNRGTVTRAHMESLQVEIYSSLAELLLPRLDLALSALREDPTLAEYVGRMELIGAGARLAQWDRTMARTSKEAALFRVFYAFLARRALADDLTLLFEAIEVAQPVTLARVVKNVFEQNLEVFLQGNGRNHLVGALSDALAELERRGDPTWGDLHRAVFTAPDGTETLLATDGDDSSVNVAQCVFWQDDQLTEHCRTTAGAVWRWVTGFAEDGTPETTFSVPQGNDRQTDDWRDGRFRPLPFRRADVEAATVSIDVLRP
jgi:penicillin amidase